MTGDRNGAARSEQAGGSLGDQAGASVFSASRLTARHDGPGPAADPASALQVSAVQEVLDGLPGSAVFLVPEFDADGAVADFRIMAASPDAFDVGRRRGKELIGLSVLETYPAVAGTELWQGYLRVLETGGRYVGEPFEYEEVVSGNPRLSRYAVRVAACRQGLIVSWASLDSGERERHRLAVMQRLGHMGWVDRDLVRNVITWSDEVYAIFDREPSLGPIRLEEFSGHTVAEDLPLLRRAAKRLLGDGKPIDLVFRVVTPGGEIRHVRFIAEAETDVEGTPVQVHGFFQDLTAAKRTEQELLDQRSAALVQDSLLAVERDLAARLQHALLPLPEQSLHLAGLTVNVAYQPLQAGLNVGGDWYSAIELPDGCALLVVGDVAGHGLEAVATMAQLRFMAKGMAITGTALPRVLTRLNTLLLHGWEQNYRTATMIMARYDPATSELTWVQAGHPPPLYLHEGRARYLPAPEGVLLGAVAAARFEASTLRLQPGDQLLLYTDGLVEKPGEDIDVSLDRLARTAEGCAGGAGALDDILGSLLGPDTRHDDVCVLQISL
ncbi:PP2C family protein-serine/threonine phosphatase [Streptomyces sp. NPDC101160]|uniref:PP2C family protein-serine/threonine phosphatase n=1 Tax=Streptomyces sp. NPDC101160 TaxID=3366118 RepID=UPI0038264895